MSAMRAELPGVFPPENESAAQSRFGEKHEEVVAGAIKQISAMDAKSLSDMREALLSHIEKAELDIRKNASGKEVKKAEKSLDKNQRKLDALNIRLKELGVEVESRESVPPESGERLTLVPDDGLEEVEASVPPEEDPFLFNLERQALPRLLEMQNELKEGIKRSSEDLGTAREEKNKSRINQLLKERGRQFDRLTKVEVQMAHLGIGPIAESLQESGLRYADPTEAQIDDQWPEEPPTNPMRVKTPVPSIESDLTVANANTSDEHLAARFAARESSTPSGRRAARTAAGFRTQAAARKSAAATASAEPSRSKAAEKPRNVAADQFPKDVPVEDFNLLPERLRRRYELKPGETTDDLPALQAKHQEERYRALSELRAPKRQEAEPLDERMSVFLYSLPPEELGAFRNPDGSFKENVRRYAEAYEGFFASKLSRELMSTLKFDGIGMTFDEAMKAFSIEPSAIGKSDSWINWHLAKLRYLHDHPESPDRARAPDPLAYESSEESRHAIQDILDRQIGREVLNHIRQSGRASALISEMNFSEDVQNLIRVGLEEDRLSPSYFVDLGRVSRRNKQINDIDFVPLIEEMREYREKNGEGPAKKAEMDQESGRDASLDRFPDDISDEDISQLPEHLRRRYELKPGESINDLPSLQAKHQEERLRALSELRAPVRQEASTDAEALPIPLVRKKGTEALKKDIQTWYTRRIEIAENPKHADERKELDQKITKAEALLDQKMCESKAAEAEAEAARIKQEMADAQARFEAGVEQANIEREREIQERRELEELEDRRRELEREYRNAAPTAWPGITKKMNEVTHEIDRKQTNLDLLDASVTDLEREAATQLDEKHALFERYEDVSKRWDVLGLSLAALALKLEGLKDVSLDVKTSADKKRLSSDEAADVKAMRKAPPSDFRKDFGDLARRTGRIGKTGFKWVGLGALMVSWGLTRPFRVIGAVLGHLYKATMNPEKFAKEVKERFSKGIKEHGPVGGSLRGAKWMFFGDGDPKKKETSSASSSHD